MARRCRLRAADARSVLVAGALFGAPIGSSLFATAAPVAAQSPVYVPDADAAQGPVNAVPLGGKGPTGGFQNVRTQILVPASFLPSGGSTIKDLAFAGGSDGTYSYAQLEVTLGHATTSGTLSATFEQNLADRTLMLRRQPTTVPIKSNQWCSVQLSGTFTHDGKRDVVVDVTIQGAFFSGTQAGSRRSQTLATVYALDWDVQNPRADGFGPIAAGAKLCFTLGTGAIVVVGSGCPKADRQPVAIGWSGSSARTQTLHVSALGATPSQPLSLLLGTSETRYGALPLPYDLAPVGAPGCLLRTDVGVLLSALADAGGAASVALPIPDDPTLNGRTILLQWLAPAPNANAVQLVLSGMLRARIR